MDIQGEGVVGQRPVLMPGENFEYTSDKNLKWLSINKLKRIINKKISL